MIPNKQYKVSICYIERDSSDTKLADSVMVLTRIDPTSVRITKIARELNNESDSIEGQYNVSVIYKVKMYNEYEFTEAMVTLTDCGEELIGEKTLNITNALSKDGDVGQINLNPDYNAENICLNLTNVKDINGNLININSYHKVKIR